MLRIRLDVNGRDIGEIGVLNTGKKDWEKTLYEIYDIRHDFPERSIKSQPIISKVWHDERDGAAALAAKVMKEVDEKLHLEPPPDVNVVEE